MSTLRAIAEQIPPDYTGGTELASRELSATGEPYEQAKATVEAQLRDGWRLIALMRRYGDREDAS